MADHKSIEARFISGSKGQLFSLHRPPREINSDSECFVLVPPFAEEMNRCRYMCTMLAEELALHGHGYLSVDFFGTGDSAGEFVEGDWQGWYADLESACAFARELGYKRISLFAIRLGAPIALEIAQTLDSLHRIILWQPVISGKSTLTQFLRIRIAASLERDETGGTIEQFEKEIDAGHPLQVAGYDLSPALYRGIKHAHLDNYLNFTRAPITWFTTLASEDRKTPRVEQKFLETWRENGADIEHITVLGPSYWAVHERTLAPTLVEATIKYVTGAA